ncbi:MAG TPA: glycosyltransferase [Acidimicrobiia bacterium]|nr:glycosyltransferase [Acidimicrobiia bacterium]
MSERRVALLSLHTSPLAQPGTGDGGGMNVYVDALATSLARAGLACDVITRAEHPDVPETVEVEAGYRVVHVPVGSYERLTKHELLEHTDDFTAAVLDHVDRHGVDYCVLHANYWISGAVGHQLKHALDRPLVATFHTLARVKADAGVDDDPLERTKVEHDVIACSDLVLASTTDERTQLVSHYAAAEDRIEIVPPGVDHEVFSSGGRSGRAHSRVALGLGRGPVLLFVGRIQPLKRADLAVDTLAELDDATATLVIVGGPSGPDGVAELARIHERVDSLGLARQVRFVAPQPHDRLRDFYRAADVCLVPSHTESFGLVALEAAACGTPVVAADVGGLRALVDHGETGFLVDARRGSDYAALVAGLLAYPQAAAAMGRRAETRSRGFAWSITAARLRRLYADLVEREPVSCM